MKTHHLLACILALSTISPIAAADVPCTVYAAEAIQSGKCGADADYQISENRLTISGKGAIDSGAFQDYTTIIELVIGEGITEIGEKAFKNCSSLQSVKLENDEVIIAPDSFEGCSALLCETLESSTVGSTTVTFLPSFKTTYYLGEPFDVTGAVENGAGNVLVREQRLSDDGDVLFVSPAKELAMNWDAFDQPLQESEYDASEFDSSKIGEYTIYFTEKSFQDENVYDEETGELLLPAGYVDTKKPVKVTVCAKPNAKPCGENAYYTLENGVLDIQGCGTINENAFEGNDEIVRVTAAKTISGIGSKAFASCPKLETVTLLNPRIDIAKDAFADCKNLLKTETNIYDGQCVIRITPEAKLTYTTLEALSMQNAPFDTTGFNPYGSGGMGKIRVAFDTDGKIIYCETTSFELQGNWDSFGTIPASPSNCDTSEVDWTKPGTYPIYFKTRQALNPVDSWQKIEITVTESPEIYNPYAGCPNTLSEDGELHLYGSGTVLSSAFRNNKDIKTVVVEPTVKGINQKAFSGCTALTSVKLLSDTTRIAQNAFQGCTALPQETRKVKLGATYPDTTKMKKTYFLGEPFKNSEITMQIDSLAGEPLSMECPCYLDANGRVIYKDTKNGENITTWELTNNEKQAYVKDKSAFDPWEVGTYTVYIEYIDHTTLNGTALKPVDVKVVDPSQPQLCGFETTYTLDENGTLTVHSESEDSGFISSYAFVHADQIKNAVIEEGVIELEEGAFMSCLNMKSVTLPESIASAAGAFEECRNLHSYTIANPNFNMDGITLSELDTVTAPENSTAQKAALAAGATFIAMETSPKVQTTNALDINSDGKVTVSDAILTARVSTNDITLSLTADELQRTDCNHDGFVDAQDIIFILKAVAKCS